MDAAVPVITRGKTDETAGVPALTACRLSKIFGPTVAVADVSFDLYPGEVLALVGENGAGKSTCVKILGGLYPPDGGEIRLADRTVQLRSPLEAHQHGIAVVHQHPGLFPDISVAENIFAGHPLRKHGWLDHAQMVSRAQDLLDQLGLQRSARERAGDLRVSEQQIVEIARALAVEAAVLLLDEPTAALTSTEVDKFFEVIATLRARGVAMMFVGHRLEEIFRVSDRIAVLRDGSLVDTISTSETTEDAIVRLMVGRTIGSLYDRQPAPLGDLVLETKDLIIGRDGSPVNLKVRAGEVVGMAGLVGSGRTEIARAIFGIDRPTAGSILLGGTPVTIGSPTRAIELGIAYVSEDRRGQSIVEDFAILDNASLPGIGHTTRFGMVNRKSEIALVSAPLDRMRLKFHDYLQPIRTLSGGNQQKVVLAKWLATNPRLLILDEPTQGIDIQAKAEVHGIIAELAAQGIAVLLISSDMPELLGACDRVYVMNHGTVAAEFARDELNQFDIGIAATRALPDQKVAPSGEASPTAQTVERRAEPVRRHRIGQLAATLFRRRETALLFALAAVIIPLSLLNTNFYSVGNLADLANYASLLGLLGLGQMMVILTRNIDLSVASTLGLSGYAAAWTMRALPQAPTIVGIGIAIGIGLICGLLNGLVVAYGKVPSIVVTLGTLALFRGALSTISSGDRVKPDDVPADWLAWTRFEFAGVSTLMLVAIGIGVVIGVLTFRTARGREIYYVGSNPDGAELIGIPSERRVLTAFTVSGLLAGLTGALWASYYPYVDGQMAFGLETAVIAAVVVGGVALRGGSGTVVGVALGTIGLLAIRKVLTISGVPDQYLQAVYGAAIIVAVSADVLLRNRTRRAGAGR